jgi:hypothetical protein
LKVLVRDPGDLLWKIFARKPPLNFPPQMSRSLAPFGNPNQLSPALGSGLQPSRHLSFSLDVNAFHSTHFCCTL